MPEKKNPASPHLFSAFFDLLGLYDRQSRPESDYWSEVDQSQDALDAARRGGYQRLFMLGPDRKRRYEIYDEMDTYGLVSAILDVYAEEATQPDYDRDQTVWVDSKDAKVREAAKDALRNLRIEDNATAIVRSMAKYGDRFQRMLYRTGDGVLGWRPMIAAEVERVEDKYGRLAGFKQNGKKFRAGQRDVSWPWDYIHFRLLGKDDQSGYGTSMLDGMFREWRRMILAEESALLYRMRRTPDRNLIQVDVGDMEAHEAMAFVNQWRKRFRKHEYVDPATPDYRKQYNPFTPIEDIVLPAIQGRESRIDTLSGSGDVGTMSDLENFQNSFFGAAKAPKAYFGFEGDINAKATLIQQDVRFARGVKRLQRAFKYGVRHAVDMHLVMLAENGSRRFPGTLPAYEIGMTPISYLDEFERLNLIELRQRVVEGMSRLATDMQLDPRVWATYILLNYARLPEDLVLKLIKKTPDEVAAPGGGPPIEREAPLDPRGFLQLSEKEKSAIGMIVHDSPGLRRSIQRMAEYGHDVDSEDVLEESIANQTDHSLLPPFVNGKPIQDSLEETEEIKTLREDLAGLRKGEELQS